MRTPTIMMSPETVGGIGVLVARLAAEDRDEEDIARGRALAGLLVDLQLRGAPGCPDPQDGLEDVVTRLGDILAGASEAEDARLGQDGCSA